MVSGEGQHMTCFGLVILPYLEHCCISFAVEIMVQYDTKTDLINVCQCDLHL